MSNIKPNDALKLAAWLAVHEPQFFRQLYTTQQKVMRSPLGRLGYFGDDAFSFEPTLTDINFDPGTVSMPDVSPSFDWGTIDPEVSLTDVSFDPGNLPQVSQNTTDAINAAIALPELDPSTQAASTSSGGFWSAIAQGASGVAGAVGKVASALLAPGTITAAGNAASAYFKSQANTAQTQAQSQAQQAAVQAQLARVAQGYSPAPITYSRNPYTGALTPVYQTNTGSVPVTPSLLSSLSSPGTMGVSPGLLVGGALAAVLLYTLATSSGKRS